MTARPFFDSVVVAAAAAGLTPILPALPCPTCGGDRQGSWGGQLWPLTTCPDCTDGVWTPPDSPVPIGVTSAEPEHVERIADHTSALPFLPGLNPDDTVYLLDGFTESVECPTCTERVASGERRWPGGYADDTRCWRCSSHSSKVGRLSCPFPVDAPDHPCVVTS